MATKFSRAITLTAAVTVASISLTGCDFFNWGSQFAPTPTPSGGSASPSPSVVVTPTPVSTPTTVATVKASGSLEFNSFSVSDVMVGTCTKSDPMTVTLADHANDFYSTVDATVVIDQANLQIVSVSIITGADQEGGVHQVTYSGQAPVNGTSARLIGSGPEYQIIGTLQDQDSPHGKPVITMIPVSMKFRCANK